jgi:hypothetical protein
MRFLPKLHPPAAPTVLRIEAGLRRVFVVWRASW